MSCPDNIIPFRRHAADVPDGPVVSSPEVAAAWFAQMRGDLDALKANKTEPAPAQPPAAADSGQPVS